MLKSKKGQTTYVVWPFFIYGKKRYFDLLAEALGLLVLFKLRVWPLLEE
jgi:hypothetical protein